MNLLKICIRTSRLSILWTTLRKLVLKFIYSEKAKKVCEIKSEVKISQNFVAFGLLRIYELYNGKNPFKKHSIYLHESCENLEVCDLKLFIFCEKYFFKSNESSHIKVLFVFIINQTKVGEIARSPKFTREVLHWLCI